MAKAVLVMDMPECCADCQLADDDTCGLYCMFADDYYDGSDSSEDRASFCPLRELPERKEEFELRECKGSLKGTWKVPLIENKGFNSCLDKILKERKE